jgi:predicted aspartyl protease
MVAQSTFQRPQLSAHNAGKLDKSHAVPGELLRGVNPCVSTAIERQNGTTILQYKRDGHHVVGATVGGAGNAMATTPT